MKQTAVEFLIEQIKSKADNLPTNTKENRMAKGIYVDCLLMARQAKEIDAATAMEMFGGKPKQQTAVEWLEDKLNNVRPTQICSIETIKEWVKQAKEMEKEQIIKTAINCHFEGVRQSAKTSEDYIKYGEQYYNETFNK